MFMDVNSMTVVREKVRSEEQSLENLSHTVDMIKGKIIDNEFNVRWESGKISYRSENLKLYLYTITTVVQIQKYLKNESCRTHDFMLKCYEFDL